MRILAVDTSCDESCASVVEWLPSGERILRSDIVHSHANEMTRYGGIVPEIASREHVKGLPLAIAEALEQAELSLKEIDWFGVSNRPGLIGALLVGVSYIKALAFALKKPFSVFNHIEAHLYSPLLISLEGGTPPPFPWIGLVVSGGHTELYRVESLLNHEWLGGTLDDAAGEAFDKIGKCLGFPYPAGPVLDQWIRKEGHPCHREAYSFPRAKVEGYSFSFSGLKTAVAIQLKKSSKDTLSIASSAQEAIIDSLTEKTLKAQRDFGISQVVITGGVACNSRLREKLKGAHFPLARHCTDNAAMVGSLAALYASQNKLKAEPWDTTASPTAE
jgi:N6-L-threonylcarbamoyladenine synthase